jgi:hypothetical protein
VGRDDPVKIRTFLAAGAAVLGLLLSVGPASAEYPDGRTGKASPGFPAYVHNGGTNTEVDASWTVPSLSYDPAFAPSGGNNGPYQWVGIGDTSGGGTLIQAGVIEHHNNTSGGITLTPFYECFGVENIINIAQTVAIGDSMYAKVECSANCTSNAAGQTWNITVQDVTRGWTSTISNHACVTLMSRAYYGVLEVGGTNIPNFGTVTYHDIHRNNAAPAMDVSDSYYFYANGAGAKSTINPSLPSGTADGFELCWGGNGGGTVTGPYASCSLGQPALVPGRPLKFRF